MDGDDNAPAAERLADLTAVLLDDAGTPGEHWHACQQMHRLLVDVARLRPEEFDPSVAAETRLRYGVAIAPQEAGHCLLDIARTRAFAAGVVDAVAERRLVEPGRPVHVLYAGCGPFATLLLPAFGRFGPDQLQCTLLDVHERSIECVERVVAELGFAPHVRAVELADAATYRIPPDSQVDVLVVECLLRGLSREPQVAITWNLVGQAGPNVILIPEEIRLDLVHVDPRMGLAGLQAEPAPIDDEPIFTLSADAARSWGPMDESVATLPARSVDVPAPPSPEHGLAVVATLKVHGGAELRGYDSGLNRPHLIDTPAALVPGTTVGFEYRLTEPGVAVLPDATASRERPASDPGDVAVSGSRGRGPPRTVRAGSA